MRRYEIHRNCARYDQVQIALVIKTAKSGGARTGELDSILQAQFRVKYESDLSSEANHVIYIVIKVTGFLIGDVYITITRFWVKSMFYRSYSCIFIAVENVSM